MPENNTSWYSALPSMVLVLTFESTFLFHEKKHVCSWAILLASVLPVVLRGPNASQLVSPLCPLVKAGDASALDKSHTPNSLKEKHSSLLGSCWESLGTISLSFLILICLIRGSWRHTFLIFLSIFCVTEYLIHHLWSFWGLKTFYSHAFGFIFWPSFPGSGLDSMFA